MWYWLIGTYKLGKAFVLLAAGGFLIYLARTGACRGLGHLAACAPLALERHFVRVAAAWLDGVDRGRLEWIGVAVILYGLLYVAQSAGLLLRRRWGSYLVIVNTGIFIPFECYEVVQGATATRLALLALNVAIVAYLAARLRRNERAAELRVGRPLALRS